VGGKVGTLLEKSPAAVRAGWQKVKDLAEREGIKLRAGDITGGRGLQRFENLPGYFPIGSTPTTTFAREGVEAAERAAHSIVTGLGRGRSTSLIQGGLAAEEEFKAAVGIYQRARDGLFTAVENAVGPTYQVNTRRIRAALIDVLERSGYAPMAAPTGAAKVSAQLEQTLTPNMLKLLRGDQITYKQARDILVEFSGLAGKDATPIGSIRRGRFNYLTREMGADIDRFIATQPARIRAMADEATQFAKRGKEVFNKILFKAISGEAGVQPQDVVRNVFDSVQTTAVFKHMASDELWQRMQTAWMSDIISKATTPGIQGAFSGFSPTAFVKLIEPYMKRGAGDVAHLDVILNKDQADRVRGLLEIFRRLTRSEQLAGPGAVQGFGGHMGFAQLRNAIGALQATVAAGLGTGGALTGHFGAGLGGAGFSLAAPYGISKLTTNPRFISAMIKGLTPTWAPTAVVMAAHLLGQGVEEVSSPRGAPMPPAAERVSRNHPAVQDALKSGLSIQDIARKYGLQVID
jgi:hypothetical protein